MYASQDEETMLRLLHHLKPLRKTYDLSIWSNDPVYPGQQWQPRIASRMHEADIFLFLLSDAFMHSEFVKQLEFKMVIDRYKAGTAKVIPVLLDPCPWDTTFESDDYNFSFNELQVLPQAGKPISDWKSHEKALETTAAALSASIRSWVGGDPVKEVAETETPKEVANDDTQDQTELPFVEEWEVNEPIEEGKITTNEVKAKRKLEEEKRGLEEAETKSIAAEKRVSEQAERKGMAEEQKRKVAEEIRKKEKERQAVEKAEAERRVLEKKLRNEAETQRKAEEKRLQFEKAHDARLAAERSVENEPEASPPAKMAIGRKKILAGSSIAALALIGIWAISKFSGSPEPQTPPVPQEDTMYAKDSTALSNTEVAPAVEEESLPNLVIGDLYEEGIVFYMDPDGKSGKIAHREDAGPMPWQDAMIIHDRLGKGWRLPTFEELLTMYTTIGQGADNRGEFSNGLYWSATDYDEYQARLLKFQNGNTSYHYNKQSEQRQFLVRAVRDFSR